MALRSDIIDALRRTLDDRRITRSEQKALRALLEERPLSASERAALEAELFSTVRDRLRSQEDREVVQWLQGALRVLRGGEPRAVERSECYFGPGDAMVETLHRLLSEVRRSVDVAVFTITDDRLTEALIDLHRGGRGVRVLTDDDKASDRGSDAHRLQRAGVAVAFDRSPHHFHHKFAVLDGERLVNGSYNWTRSADRDNRENFLVTSDPFLVAEYGRAFEGLWGELGR